MGVGTHAGHYLERCEFGIVHRNCRCAGPKEERRIVCDRPDSHRPGPGVTSSPSTQPATPVAPILRPPRPVITAADLRRWLNTVPDDAAVLVGFEEGRGHRARAPLAEVTYDDASREVWLDLPVHG